VLGRRSAVDPKGASANGGTPRRCGLGGLAFTHPLNREETLFFLRGGLMWGRKLACTSRFPTPSDVHFSRADSRSFIVKSQGYRRPV